MNNRDIEMKQMKARKIGAILGGLGGAFFVFCGVAALLMIGEAADYADFLGLVMFVLGGGAVSIGLAIIGFFNDRFVYANEYIKQHSYNNHPSASNNGNRISPPQKPNTNHKDNFGQKRPMPGNNKLR